MTTVLDRSEWPANDFPGATTRTVSYTLPSGTGRRLLVTSFRGGVSTTGVTYDGEAMTAVGADETISSIYCRAFVYDVPDGKSAGAYNLVFTFAGSSDGHAYRARTFTGATGSVSQTSDFTTTSSSSATVAATSGDLLCASGIVLPAGGTGVTSFGSSQVSTADVTGDTSGAGFRILDADAIGDATENVTFTLVPSGTTESGVFLVRVAEAGSSGPSAAAKARYRSRSRLSRL